MSYITVPAKKVIKCCENWIIYNHIRNCQDAAKILKEKAKDKKHWLFGPEIGYHSAWDYLVNTDNFGPSLEFAACFWVTEWDESVRNLLNLAKNGDPVMITDKHAFIFNFEDITFKKVEE